MALDALIHRRQTSWLKRFQQAPCPTLAKTLYSQRRRFALHCMAPQATEHAQDITVVCVSDTHNSQPKVPPGDILIHAGDLTQGGTAKELQAQLDWLNAQSHTHKITIAGNHDIVLDAAKSAAFGHSPEARASLRWGSVIYLEHSACEVEIRGRRLSLFGHPSTRKHGNWAFQYPRGIDAFSHVVPEGIDVLITHSAPQFHLDLADWGDDFLLQELWHRRPKLHVFGHIHAGYGRDILIYDKFEHLYEHVCSGRMGIIAVLQMLLLLLQTIVMGFERKTNTTILINASAAGGLLDEKIHEVQIARL